MGRDQVTYHWQEHLSLANSSCVLYVFVVILITLCEVHLWIAE